jgi:hypothetical protein
LPPVVWRGFHELIEPSKIPESLRSCQKNHFI